MERSQIEELGRHRASNFLSDNGEPELTSAEFEAELRRMFAFGVLDADHSDDTAGTPRPNWNPDVQIDFMPTKNVRAFEAVSPMIDSYTNGWNARVNQRQQLAKEGWKPPVAVGDACRSLAGLTDRLFDDGGEFSLSAEGIF